MASAKEVRSASAPHDDSDLEDLIAKSPLGKPRSNVEIDSSAAGGGGFLSVTPLGFIAGSCRLFCYQCPCLSKCVLSLLAVGLFALLLNTVFNPTAPTGIMGADYSAITSAYDLSLSKVHHWCIQGDNDSCKCENPLEATSRSEFKSWNAAHKSNVADVNMYRAVYGSKPTLIDEATGKARPPIDVAFLGESVVEAMDGRWLGKRVVKALNTRDGRDGPEKKKPDIGKVFERLFRREKGAPVEGVALGIAGDNTANVLWRLQHDEMPYDFNPQVWWLVLGMNDLTRMQCSEEIVVLGILRVVEEIRLRKPDAKIVINSLLPMVNYQQNVHPRMADFVDFKNNMEEGARGAEVEKAMKNYFGSKGPGRPVGMNAGNQKGVKERGLGRRVLRSRKKMSKKQRHGRHEKDDEATEGKELEEAMERRKKILERTDKRIRDKVFRDDEKYHPKRPLSPFLPIIRKHVLPPVWPSVHLINAKLKEFCSKHDSITFFDATPIFASNEGGGRHHLHNELISPRGHPSELGFAVWEGQIMGRLHRLIAEKAEKEPVPDSVDDLDEEEDHPEIEELSPVSEASEASPDLVKDSGDGTEHVSDGKESDPPPKVEQPSRDAPATEKKRGSTTKGEKLVPAGDEESSLTKRDKRAPAGGEKSGLKKRTYHTPAEDEKSSPTKRTKLAPAEDEKSSTTKRTKLAPAEDEKSSTTKRTKLAPAEDEKSNLAVKMEKRDSMKDKKYVRPKEEKRKSAPKEEEIDEEEDGDKDDSEEEEDDDEDGEEEGDDDEEE